MNAPPRCRGLSEAIGDTANAVAARKRTATPVVSTSIAPDATPAGNEPHFDRHGQVMPDLALRRNLDHDLAAQDAPPVATQRQHLDHDLAATIPAAQARQILAWFDRYAAYLQAEAAGSPLGTGPDQQAQHARALRERLLGSQAASAFFADETATR